MKDFPHWVFRLRKPDFIQAGRDQSALYEWYFRCLNGDFAAYDEVLKVFYALLFTPEDVNGLLSDHRVNYKQAFEALLTIGNKLSHVAVVFGDYPNAILVARQTEELARLLSPAEVGWEALKIHNAQRRRILAYRHQNSLSRFDIGIEQLKLCGKEMEDKANFVVPETDKKLRDTKAYARFQRDICRNIFRASFLKHFLAGAGLMVADNVELWKDAYQSQRHSRFSQSAGKLKTLARQFLENFDAVHDEVVSSGNCTQSEVTLINYDTYVRCQITMDRPHDLIDATLRWIYATYAPLTLSYQLTLHETRAIAALLRGHDDECARLLDAVQELSDVSGLLHHANNAALIREALHSEN